MTGIPDLEETIARIETATEAAREATREVHSAIKALQQSKREALAAQAQIREQADTAVGDAITHLIETAIETIAEQQKLALAEGREYVLRQFEEYANLCMYGNTQGRGTNIFDEMRDQALRHQTQMKSRVDLPSLKPPRSLHGQPS